ncbi:uncharacterized protein MYCFIDRAFT_205747 [Pseudocercospora fijiensis CIRAD86]|uniref:Uncharacterized protein n=1 Tax=Pseudocercospora fijiensis (strain CIRAD86) TaxID=383855 RepID=N1Q639_PSEFD|nr:uncharacterized protein MYCFIDRAFT_205747 [Pseudocercospora fijiensis CIRAD86]EME87645.1 hypothetical protein MYCFIDRAFT_205747 [Pseudocercospora fijiensis CIRAD86]
MERFSVRKTSLPPSLSLSHHPHHHPSIHPSNHPSSLLPRNKPLPIVQLRQWSDLTSLEYIHLSSSSPQNLRWIFRRNITNRKTQEMITKALRKKSKQSDSDFKAKPWPGDMFEPGHEGFEALIATPNVSGVVWMLVQHEEEFGRKEIKSLRVWWDGKGVNYTPNLMVREVGGWVKGTRAGNSLIFACWCFGIRPGYGDRIKLPTISIRTSVRTTLNQNDGRWIHTPLYFSQTHASQRADSTLASYAVTTDELLTLFSSHISLHPAGRQNLLYIYCHCVHAHQYSEIRHSHRYTHASKVQYSTYVYSTAKQTRTHAKDQDSWLTSSVLVSPGPGCDIPNRKCINTISGVEIGRMIDSMKRDKSPASVTSYLQEKEKPSTTQQSLVCSLIGIVTLPSQFRSDARTLIRIAVPNPMPLSKNAQMLHAEITNERSDQTGFLMMPKQCRRRCALRTEW